VVVAYQNRVVMEETLDAGLAQLFGGPARRRASPRECPRRRVPPRRYRPAPPISRAARTIVAPGGGCAARGDWARYGEELRRLEDVLRQLQAAVGERKP